MKKIVTRFAPSPTGYLHIGSARTALFNYLFAKANDGKFLLRIEDTDRERSSTDAVNAILDGLKWLGLSWDEEEVYQFARAERHREVALELLTKGKAYKCFLTPAELDVLRNESMHSGKPIVSKWRDVDPIDHPDLPYVVRIKAQRSGVTIIDDKVQGRVVTENATLDDMILLRSDGSPTYMHAVVVDDHDMEVTHIIRGDDHLSNTPRQITIYQAMGWDIPSFAHIPLIHGEDGKKLSKRHGALGVDAYREMGYLPETICNYLFRLGWSHGDDEIISSAQAIEWFNLESIGRSPARLDFKKIDNLNHHYLALADNQRLLEMITNSSISKISKDNILQGMDSLKQRAKTILELKESIKIYIVESKIEIPEELKLQILSKGQLVDSFISEIFDITSWNKDELMSLAKIFAEKNQMKLGELAGVLRILLTGSNASPSVFEIMAILGKDESIKRFKNAYNS
jgi:glutamyl-tRNA synthetase